MSKINQIQNKLRELGGAAFQKLADAYLYKKGYERINSIGSVIGTDNVRKGTPDTLISLANGKYVFAEYTIQKEGVYKKLKSDLDKCFDESKTGIRITKIEEVVFCHTSTLNTDEQDALREECQKCGVNLNIFDIGSISYDLHLKYPGIARDFLGVEVDTGQVVAPDEFVTNYNKNALATPLNTTFHFREEELERVLQGLDESNLVVVSGKAGVGKTRLVLQCCNQFVASHSEYKVRCIFLRGADIFEDLRIHFSEPGSYLIFVDDANRVSRFEYFIQLLHDQRSDQQIKVIATVRDYALNKVREAARSYKNLIELEVKSLEDNQIKQLVEDEYSITNQVYLDRIADISQGNPRLAIMIADVAKRENTLKSIIDVSSLYDEYYRSIRQDLEQLGDENLLKTAGIVAFFRTVDRSHEEMMRAIKTVFGIPQELFWKAVRQLHDLELLDMHENEVVRTSDQVLATYLFYLAFFKEQTLKFSVLIKNFFPDFQYRLVDVLNPVLNTFDHKNIIEIMRPHVDQAWETYKEAGDETKLMHLMEVFWFLKKTDILLYVRDCISKMEPESIDISKLEIKPNSNIPSPSLLKTLGLFSYSDEDNLRMALVLLLDYLTKRPSELSRGLHLLTEQFGFEHDSYVDGFFMQQTVIDVLWERVKEGEEEMFSKLFLALAEQYLPTHFNTTKMKGRRAFNILNFDLLPTRELIELRRTIWKRVFKLYQIPIFREEVLNLIHKYSTSGYKIAVVEIITQDAADILPFIESALDSCSYCHCLVVQDYLNHLEKHQVPFNEDLRGRFTNETYALSKVLLFSGTERKYFELESEEYQQFKRQQIEEYFADYSFANYEQFFQQCLEIQGQSDRRKHNGFHFSSRVVEVLIALSNRDPDLYIEVIKHYLGLGEPFKFNELRLINRLIQILGVKKAHEFLNQIDYPSKRRWLFNFYRLLTPEDITFEYLDHLYILYRESEPSEIPRDLNFLLKYCLLDSNVVVRVTEILLEKITENLDYSYALSPLFDLHIEENKTLLDLFKNNLDSLKKAYLAILKVDWHTDDNGQYFEYILDIDPNFILEYINWIYEQKEQSYHFDNTRDYSFLWRHESYEVLMSQVVDHVYEKELEQVLLRYNSLKDFFILLAEAKDNTILQERQDKLLKRFIETRHQDIEFTQFVFNVITQISYERRSSFIALFLEHNKKIEDFKKLSLESNFLSWEGSAVPMYQKRVEYLESLLPLLNTVDFLQHKQYIEQKIQYLRGKIEQEKKKDFMED
ncbi:ATP-binding protein [Nostocaceae cyanobacterium CENA369]|uniref:ATP-binding protein n=1 Tax=Dendronalium phyllosphericum CENA369 TaxID=1725256 RepID=A0A8J7LF88_9NOST|nr:ATP-binding protein [Dendronalium phyllosphericum]MBH8574961.1 ATP-binding protein [Dendronalium phyllosphericum CENA369]